MKKALFFTIGATVGVTLSILAKKLWDYDFKFANLPVDDDDPEFNKPIKTDEWAGQD
jgi:hypothetical protein